jgi:4-diphosphocytidyl-2-C-methyl-D-erythritol kinase
MTIKAYAKVNIFLKIVGTRGSYHELLSRFMRVDSLYDTITFEKKEKPCKEFELKGEFSCDIEKNTIYKAYQLLLEQLQNKNLELFFETHRVVVEKKIPEFAGLGGGSSNAASFLNLTNEVLSLRIKQNELANLGAKIGADVPFFIYNFKSANVSGIGEVVEEFKEEQLKIKTITPDIACDTAKVYTKYRENYLDTIKVDFAKELAVLNSKEILQNYDAKELNDLFEPAKELYPKLKEYHKPNWFFSGSGRTFFSHG